MKPAKAKASFKKPTDETPADPNLSKDDPVVKAISQRAEAWHEYIKTQVAEWQGNIDRRIGKIADTIQTNPQADEVDIRMDYAPDWSLTKAKVAALWSNQPPVLLTHDNDPAAAAVGVWAKELNFQLGPKRANVGTAMEEVANDIVNASGIGGIFVGLDARYMMVNQPIPDMSLKSPEEIAAMQASPEGVPMTQVPEAVSQRLYVARVAPPDIIAPVEFTGSDFNQADLLGYRGRDPWPTAKAAFNLKDEDKQKYLKQDDRTERESLRTTEISERQRQEREVVTYDRIFYKRATFDPDEMQLGAIWEIVFIKGQKDPVVHRPWAGQKIVPDPRNPKRNVIIGATKYPIQVGTITYISDHPVPPSDTTMGRPSCNELRHYREQMRMQRQSSQPIRWLDSVRVTPSIAAKLQTGQWNGFVPTLGPGDKAIGEIARASYPAEDLTFANIIKQDLMETWRLGPNQMGTLEGGGAKTAAEVKTAQGNFSSGMAPERAKIARLYCNVAEVLSGLLVITGIRESLTDDELQRLQAWDSMKISHELIFTVRPDSTMLIDAEQRLEQLYKVLNLLGKSPFVDPTKQIIPEILELNNLDPGKNVKQAQPPSPPPPNISLRISGAADLMSPLVLAFLVKSGQAPGPQELAAAQQLLQAASAALQPAQPAAPPGASGPVGPQPPPPTGAVETPHPGWTMPPAIAKRAEDLNQG